MIDHEITLRRKERYRNNNITMKLERIKEIQKETAYPDSISVQQALLKVWNECQQTLTDESDCSRIHYESNKDAEPLEESEWISVKDRMPKEIKFKAEDYLVFNDQGEIEVCFINNGVFRDQREDRNVIASHWKHLPEPPKNK